MIKPVRRSIALLVVMVMLAALVIGCSSSGSDTGEQTPKAQTQYINIATGGTAGTYYPLGGAMAEILKDSIPGVNATAEATNASVANVNLLNGGSVQLAFIQNDVSYYADKGEELFQDNQVTGLRALCTLYPETVQMITLKSSGIKSVADMKGKRIAVGAAGSGVEANARQILLANGITYDDIQVQYLSFAEAANGLKDGNIDAGFITAGFPTAAIQDIAAQHDVVLIPVDDATADKLMAQYPFYTKITIPAGTYPKQEADVQSLAVKAMLVTTEDMDEQLAYDIVKAIYSNLDKLKAAHSVGELINKETAKEGISIPMHPGAEKYFDE
ncbi:MAG TPA: TAXI family TRAP transporter solute-binding subunit [Syntrophomonadaceae bacterium]|nr:TAXI family TRAP transporter solute-binding subunit [Syntrophomonadaceae bacterium]HQA06634.1 TAXI family TRAP transporter solute-binding subunit [Syntrophomonadaceae bacterium]HQE22293.1 TAXI family TRAP transporter solute-binding subunit [Syntrophomonadaceae bacterium]